MKKTKGRWIKILIASILLSSFIFVIPPPIQHAKGAQTTDFDDYITLAVNSSYIDNPLRNFTVLVYDSSWIASLNETSFTFFDEDGNELCWELEKYDSSTGELIAWVKLPYISNETDTVFYLYYDNSPSSDGGENNPEQAWDEHYVAVYHLHEQSSTQKNSVNLSDLELVTEEGDPEEGTDAKIDGGNYYSGADCTSKANYSSSLPSTDITVSFWYKVHEITTDDWEVIISQRDPDAKEGWNFCQRDYDNTDYPKRVAWTVYSNDGGVYKNSNRMYSPPVATNTWYHFTGTYTEDHGQLYVNGSLCCESYNDTDTWANTEDLWVGGAVGDGSANDVEMTIDEIRISNIVRNASWIKAEYHSMASSDFIIWNYSVTNQPPVISNPYPSNGLTDVTLQPLCHIDVSDTDGDTMTVYWYEGNWTKLTQTESWGPNVHSHSGVTVDGTYFYTTDSTSVYKFWMSNQSLIMSYNLEDDDTNVTFDHYGGLKYVDGILYITECNYPSTSYNGGVIEVWASNLTFKDEHVFNLGYYVDGIDFKDGYFWIRMDKGGNEQTVMKITPDFNLSNKTLYPLPSVADDYQGIAWYHNDLFVTTHDENDIYRFHFNGTAFIYVREYCSENGTAPPSCNQGMDYYKPFDRFYICQREYPSYGDRSVTICKLEGFKLQQTNSSVTNGTYCWTYSNATSYNTTYWWKVEVTDGIDTTTAIYHFTTASNSPPVVSNPYPANGSEGVSLQPTCHIDINDAEGDTMTIYWYENSTGSWVLRQTNSSVENGTYYWTFSQASSYNTTYWWKVAVNDSINNVTAIYHFTTATNNPPTISNPIPANGSVGVDVQPICYITVNDTEGNLMTIYWYENTTGSWILRQTNSSVTNGTYSWQFTQASSYGEWYWWKVAVNDSTNNVTKIYKFRIIASPTVETHDATNVGTHSATLRGNLTDDGGEECTVWFEYGTTTSYGSTTTQEDNKTSPYDFSHNLVGLSPGTLYHYRAVAQNSNGTSYGGDKTFLTKPYEPSNLTANLYNDIAISLTWTKGEGAERTVIVRKTGGYPTSISDGTVVYNDTGTSFIDSGLSPGTVYYYSAWSYVDADGLYQYSDGYASTTNYTYPSPPTDIIVTDVTDTSLTFSWTKGEGSDRTLIYRGSTLITNTTDTTFSDNGLSPSTFYTYKLYAYDSESGLTSQDYATISHYTAPSPPSDFSFSGDQNIYISWTKGEGSDYTLIRWSNTSFPSSITDGWQLYNGTDTSVYFAPNSSLLYITAWAYYSDSGLYSNATTAFYITNLNPPTLTLTYLSNHSINVSWSVSVSENINYSVMIRYSTSTYPESREDGILLVNSSANYTILTNATDSDYYFSAWTWGEKYGNGRWSSTYSTAHIRIYIKNISIVNEENGNPFNLSKVYSFIVSVPEKNWSIDLKEENVTTFEYNSSSPDQLKFEVKYSENSEAINRYINISLIQESNFTVGYPENVTTFYEQIIYSKSPIPILLKNIETNCYILAGYTQFVKEDAVYIPAYTINKMYRLMRYENGYNVIGLLNGGKASEINLDLLLYNTSAIFDIPLEGVGIKKVSSSLFLIYYKNENNDNVKVRIQIYDGDNVIFDYNETATPNEFSIYFDISGIFLNNTNLKVKVTAYRVDGGHKIIVKYFSTTGAEGILNSAVGMIIAVGLMIFGISLVASRHGFGIIGIALCGISIAITAISTPIWYVTFFQAVFIIILVVIILMFKEEGKRVIY